MKLNSLSRMFPKTSGIRAEQLSACPPSTMAKPDSMPLAESLPDFLQVGIVADDAAGWRGFLGDIPFAYPLRSGAVPLPPRLTVIDFQATLLNFTVLYVLEPAPFLHWLLHRCEATPILTELHVFGAHECEVFTYWHRVNQSVSDKVLSNDNHITKGCKFKRMRASISKEALVIWTLCAEICAGQRTVSFLYHSHSVFRNLSMAAFGSTVTDHRGRLRIHITSTSNPRSKYTACSAGLKKRGLGAREVHEKTPPTSDIFRHDSHMRKSGMTRPGIEPGSPWCEASRLTAGDPKEQQNSKLLPFLVEEGPCFVRRFLDAMLIHIALYLSLSLPPLFYTHTVVVGAAVAERSALSPSTKAIRVQSPAESPRIFACGNRGGRCRFTLGFLGDLPFPPLLYSGAAPFSSQSPSSDLKTSIGSELKCFETQLVLKYFRKNQVPISIVMGCCLLEKAFSYLTGPLRSWQYRHDSGVIRVQTVNTFQKCFGVQLALKSFREEHLSLAMAYRIGHLLSGHGAIFVRVRFHTSGLLALQNTRAQIHFRDWLSSTASHCRCLPSNHGHSVLELPNSDWPSQNCYWLRVVQGVSNKLRSNCKLNFSVHVLDGYLVLKGTGETAPQVSGAYQSAQQEHCKLLAGEKLLHCMEKQNEVSDLHAPGPVYVKAVRDQASTLEINFRKMTLPLPAYILMGTMIDMLPLKLVSMYGKVHWKRRGRNQLEGTAPQSILHVANIIRSSNYIPQPCKLLLPVQYEVKSKLFPPNMQLMASAVATTGAPDYTQIRTGNVYKDSHRKRVQGFAHETCTRIRTGNVYKDSHMKRVQGFAHETCKYELQTIYSVSRTLSCFLLHFCSRDSVSFLMSDSTSTSLLQTAKRASAQTIASRKNFARFWFDGSRGWLPLYVASNQRKL
ncbi:hypothetical protein PR048_022778 [Dryococelus australis]|uniref:Uncharacterized protein n=1 Tax=Dryococelus australis TaxID=614101 RepID=A0ABQ9GSA1_9NEOP|nr:hypothetical protein PR048_022778 [Dryococelus australis]